MSVMHQLANATLAAVFSTAMLLAAHCFTEYRAARHPAIAAAPPFSPALQRRPATDPAGTSRNPGYVSVNWGNGAI